jgi:hypothetical protein
LQKLLQTGRATNAWGDFHALRETLYVDHFGVQCGFAPNSPCTMPIW